MTYQVLPINVSIQLVTIPDSENRDIPFFNYLFAVGGVTAVVSVPAENAKEFAHHLSQITSQVLASPETAKARRAAKLIIPRTL